MMQRKLLVGLAFFVLPALVYLGLLTRFTFDPFDPQYGWQAYNYLALALFEGRQDIPAEVIAGEGLYIGGKVYMYYGLLPAVMRLPLMAFVDLRTVPVSNLMVFIMLIAGQWAMQLAVLRIFIANGRTNVWADRAVLVFISLSIWFMSGPFLIAQNANFYHEPYAAALMLVGIYTAMLSDDLLVKKRRPEGFRLLAYALIAGLCVYTRQSCAIGLYFITLALLLPNWDDLRAQPGPAIAATLRRAVVPLLILFIFGAGFLALAYLRIGKIGTGWTVEDYGYYILGNNRPRLRTLINQQFSLIRVIPNTIYYLIGGRGLREHLIFEGGGGLVLTFGPPVRLVVLAALPLAMAATGFFCMMRRLVRREPLSLIVTLGALGFSVTALVVLAYATVQYRYSTEFSPMIFWLVLIALRDVDPSRFFGRWLNPALIGMVLVTSASAAYAVQSRVTLVKDAPRNRGSLRIGVPLAPELMSMATGSGASDPEIIINRNRLGPDPDLPPNWVPPKNFPSVYPPGNDIVDRIFLGNRAQAKPAA